jgi:hypothetical protein
VCPKVLHLPAYPSPSAFVPGRNSTPTTEAENQFVKKFLRSLKELKEEQG